MTDPNQKTLVDAKPYGATPAGHVDDTVRDLDTRAASAPNQRDTFDPYKFQAHAMPPELRAEILEGSVVVDDETQRVADTVLIKRVVRRRFRRRALAVGLVFGCLGAALTVWTRDSKQRTTAALPAPQVPRPLPSSALPHALPPVAKVSALEARSAATRASVSLPAPPLTTSTPPPAVKSPSPRRAAAVSRRPLAPAKLSASNTTATDLLDFQGPAPK